MQDQFRTFTLLPYSFFVFSSNSPRLFYFIRSCFYISLFCCSFPIVFSGHYDFAHGLRSPHTISSSIFVSFLTLWRSSSFSSSQSRSDFLPADISDGLFSTIRLFLCGSMKQRFFTPMNISTGDSHWKWNERTGPVGLVLNRTELPDGNSCTTHQIEPFWWPRSYFF